MPSHHGFLINTLNIVECRKHLTVLSKQFVGNTKFSKIHFKKPGLLHYFFFFSFFFGRCAQSIKRKELRMNFSMSNTGVCTRKKKRKLKLTNRLLFKPERPHMAVKKKKESGGKTLKCFEMSKFSICIFL